VRVCILLEFIAVLNPVELVLVAGHRKLGSSSRQDESQDFSASERASDVGSLLYCQIDMHWFDSALRVINMILRILVLGSELHSHLQQYLILSRSLGYSSWDFIIYAYSKCSSRLSLARTASCNYLGAYFGSYVHH
jgi:hypothetical protein